MDLGEVSIRRRMYGTACKRATGRGGIGSLATKGIDVEEDEERQNSS